MNLIEQLNVLIERAAPMASFAALLRDFTLEHENIAPAFSDDHAAHEINRVRTLVQDATDDQILAARILHHADMTVWEDLGFDCEMWRTHADLIERLWSVLASKTPLVAVWGIGCGDFGGYGDFVCHTPDEFIARTVIRYSWNDEFALVLDPQNDDETRFLTHVQIMLLDLAEKNPAAHTIAAEGLIVLSGFGEDDAQFSYEDFMSMVWPVLAPKEEVAA